VIAVNAVVAEVRQFLERTIGEHVQLEIALEPDLPRVLADPGRIEQVLVNLAVNARDAMSDGGQLTITTESQHVDDAFADPRPGLGTGLHVVIHVADTGSGMDPETQKRAFEPFFTTKAPAAGSGLGLATVYGIVSQAEGYIEVASEVGVGTVFTVYLPATAREATPTPATVTAARRPPDRCTILLVEDERAMRDVTRRILERRGHRVLVAGSGREAVELAAASTEPIDVLLTDVIMPEMLGRDVAAGVSRVQPGVRVLYMSGYDRPVLTSDGRLELGVVLMEKPFDEATLLDKLREVLGGGAAGD
jgi:hypothetical protein